MTVYYAKSTASSIWLGNHAYSLGDRVVCTRNYGTAAAKKYVFEATVAGTSATTPQPTWPTTPGNTVVDGGTLTWTCREATSWANATYHIDYLLANRCVAGDVIYVASTHAESITGGATLSPSNVASGIYDAPIRILSVTEATPPATLTAGATITVDENTAAGVGTGAKHWWGITWNAGANFFAGPVSPGTYDPVNELLENCSIVFGINSGSQGPFALGNTDPGYTLFQMVNTSITTPNASKTALLAWAVNAGRLIWEGGGIVSGGQVAGIMQYATSPWTGQQTDYRGCDLSAFGSGKILVDATKAGGFADIRFDYCKLGASVSKFDGVPGGRGGRMEMRGADTALRYLSYFKTYEGEQFLDTATYRASGAAEETQAYSWKIVTTAKPHFAWPFRSESIAKWVATTGTVTVSVDILHDSATALTNADIWLEVMAMGTSGNPLGTWSSNRVADMLTAGSAHSTNAPTWTISPSMTNANKQVLGVAGVVIAKAGYVYARVRVAKASYTVYVNPQITVA